RTFCAMTRALEIVSEAVRHLPPAVRGRHPELPRRAIIGVGKSTAAITIMSQKNLFGALCNKAFPRCWRD
ncbi:MAG: hypothetical protein ACREDA_10315, partial [Methylocella sp.]